MTSDGIVGLCDWPYAMAPDVQQVREAQLRERLSARANVCTGRQTPAPVTRRSHRARRLEGAVDHWVGVEVESGVSFVRNETHRLRRQLQDVPSV